MATRERAYERLRVDERRRRLLALGAELFTRHSYDELTMADIAVAGGISKPLLYHYFPSKQAFFVAVIEAAVADVRAALEPDSELPPAEQLERTLDAYLAWIDANGAAYAKLLRSASAAPEVRDLVERVRGETADRIAAALGASDPRVRTAAAGWLWFIDGACLDWIARRDVSREQVRAMLLGALRGALGG